MNDKIEAVDRYSFWSGEKTHTDYYDESGKVASSVDRYDWSGNYDHTDYYSEK